MRAMLAGRVIEQGHEGAGTAHQRGGRDEFVRVGREFAGLRRGQRLVEIKEAGPQGSRRAAKGAFEGGARLRLCEAEDGRGEERARRGGGRAGAAHRRAMPRPPRNGWQRTFQREQDQQAPREGFKLYKPGTQAGRRPACQEGTASGETEAQAADQFIHVIVRPPPGDENETAKGLAGLEHDGSILPRPDGRGTR